MKKLILLLSIFCLAQAAAFAQAEQYFEGIEVPKEVEAFVEDGTKPITLESADLNGDGTKDYILVSEKLTVNPEDDMAAGQRPLLILVRDQDGKLSQAKRSDNVVFCRRCGGIFGDPFEGVHVSEKAFTVHHYGGSSWRWSNSFQFNYSRIDKTWQLVRVEETSFHTSDPNKVKTKVYTPPKDFGKIDIADFDPENYLKKGEK